MMLFDITDKKTHVSGEKKKNVLYEKPEFKMRVLNLAPGEIIPKCEMTTYVIFVCIEGEAEVGVNRKNVTISRGQGLVSEPATLSMRTDSGALLLGIQIVKKVAE